MGGGGEDGNNALIPDFISFKLNLKILEKKNDFLQKSKNWNKKDFFSKSTTQEF